MTGQQWLQTKILKQQHEAIQRQGEHMVSGLDLTKATLENSQRVDRAWITLETLDIEAFEAAGDRTVVVGLRNFGRTPARITEANVTVRGARFVQQTVGAGVSNTQVSMDGRGRALDNVFVERLWRSVKYEEVYLHDYGTVPNARAGLGGTSSSTTTSGLTRRSGTARRPTCTLGRRRPEFQGGALRPLTRPPRL
jgi:hypothetical protein